METIPAIYWMIIIGVLTIFMCFVLYQLAMLLKESKNTIVEVKQIVNGISPLLEDATEIVGTIKNTVSEVSILVINPARKISSVLSIVSGFLEGVTKK